MSAAVVFPWKNQPAAAAPAAPAKNPSLQVNGAAAAAHEQRMVDYALAYAARGWVVFPAPPGGKLSYVSGEKTNGNRWGATKDPDEIKKYFDDYPRAGIGLPTGPGSGFWVMEADTPEGHDVDGIASLKQLEAEHGPLPETLMAESPSGSPHYYLNYPPGVMIRNSTSKIGPGIDVLGEGGMVIAPPSIRPGKGTYRWLNAAPIADAPPWLIELVTAGDSDAPHKANSEPEADPALLAAAMAVIPNDAVHADKPPGVTQQEYNKIGMACFAAFGGSAEGFAAFDAWARKSKKYHGGTVERWNNYRKHPPSNIGAGTIIFMADEASPGWREAYEETSMDDATRAALADVAGVLHQAAATKDGARTMSTTAGHPLPPRAAQDTPPTSQPSANGAGLAQATQAPQPTGLKTHLIQSSGEFVSEFVPPDYLIDGWLQRRFVYSITGMTGHGKTTVMLFIAICAALGIKIDGREVEKCRVLFFAGENPDDIRMRWIKLCEEIEKDPADVDVFFLPGTPPISNEEIRKRIDAEAAQHGPFGLLIIDTSAAYFQGDEENSNTQLGNHARMMRSFVGLPGRPTVVVTCHPTKNPDMTNLLPRGGGAFLAEVDGNLVCIKGDGTVSIHWHGKFRGPDFAPILFKLKPGTTEKLKDKKGRPIWTITAAPISEAEKADIEDVGRARQNELLLLLETNSRLSLAEMAEKLGWQYKNGLPNTSLAYRMLAALVQDKLAVKKRGKITLTKAGEQEVAAAKKAKDEIPV